MDNNQVLARIQNIFNYDNAKLIEIFSLTKRDVTADELSGWLGEDKNLVQIQDAYLASFLNGLIIEKRGAKDGPLPIPEEVLTNNIVFKKLRIALNLQAEEILEILELDEIKISKHELSSMFRREDHKNYRACEDSLLISFLDGVSARADQNS